MLRAQSSAFSPQSVAKMDIMKAADQIYAGSARPDLHLPLGTPEAIAHGCRCAPAIKPDGSLLLDNNDKQVYRVEKSCPVHG
jgi:hypothetical protein